MKSKPRLAEDPVVKEIRSIRAELWREAGGTVAGLIRLLEQRKPPKRQNSKSRNVKKSKC